MRWIFIAVIFLLVAIVVAFAFQNSALVSLTFFQSTFRAPLAFFALLFYVLGGLTGAAALAAIRYLVEGSRRRKRVAG